MNWSMIDLRAVREVAELRLPEHERLGRGGRVAVLEADAGVLGERRVVDLEGRRRARRDAASACSARRSATSWRTRWRCENVPRSVSWPVSRTGMPSTSSEANASASAWPQSIPPSSSAARRRSSWRASFGWTVKPSGTRSSSSFSSRRRSSRTAVSTASRRRRAARARRATSPGCPGRTTPAAARAPRAARASTCGDERRPPPRASTPSLDELLRVELAHRRVARRSARPSAAACRRPRPARCGRSAGSRRGR